MSATGHVWKFFRAGGVDQVQIRSGADIANLEHLDQKLWLALACPAKGLELDAKTLALLDLDGDGRIRVQEVLASIRWLKEVHRDLDGLLRGGESVALAAIDDRTPAGKALLAGARRILQDLGKAQATAITLSDVASTERIFAATRFNGDGVIPADSAGDDAVARQAIDEVIATLGPVTDRSGKPGADQKKVDAFFAEAAALVEWRARGAADPAVLPLGDATAAAAQALAAVRAKVDDSFARCRLAAFDPRATGPLNRGESDLVALASLDLTEQSPAIAKLPLARVEAGRPLPLGEGLNPAWSAAMAELVKSAVTPLLGARASLTEGDWASLVAKLAPFQAWSAAKPATAVEKLGFERLRALVASDAKERITRLIEQDRALEAEVAQLASVEKLLLFQRDLVKFLNNFVSFTEFYARRGATFQAGTLYLDGRSCNLCIRVEDAGKHAALAGLAKSYLAYCDCVRPATNEKMTIAAAFTDGDSDNLLVGRNGLFYDRKGDDWDATITRVIENPISIREAFWAPYKRFVRLVEEQVAKRAAAADTAAHGKLATAATATANADQGAPAAEPAKKIDVGTVAAIGVTIAGVATFLSTVMAAFFGLGRWMPVGLAGIVLAISGPSMLIAWLKLRQRNLGPILDANGWAVNGRVRINVPFGGALTDVARLPKNSERSFTDPYAEKKRPWRLYLLAGILVAAALAYYLGVADRHVPEEYRSTHVLGEWAWVQSGTATTKK